MQSIDSLHVSNPEFVAGAAANQDYLRPTRPGATVISPNSTPAATTKGWDPHEVWQRMIKEPRERRLTQES